MANEELGRRLVACKLDSDPAYGPPPNTAEHQPGNNPDDNPNTLDT